MNNNSEQRYQVEFGKLFAIEFENYPKDQQDAIIKFIEVFLKSGLTDFTHFEGKIAPSWKGLQNNHPHYNFAKKYNLWHYHIGIPDYQKSQYGDYLTSDYIVHFMLQDNRMKIVLIDTTAHYRSDGSFWFPRAKYLE